MATAEGPYPDMETLAPPPEFHWDSTQAAAECGTCRGLRPTKPNSFYTAFKITRLADSIRAGCKFCKVVGHTLSAFRKFLPAKIVHDETCYIEMWNFDISKGGSLQIHILKTKDGREDTFLSLEVYGLLDLSSSFPVIGSKLCRNISRDSSSPSCLNLARAWIENCTKTHSPCRYRPTRLPNRVVDVGSDTQDPKLYMSRGEWGRYVTLSHCWGAVKPTQTTIDTLPKMTTGIPVETLPKTFQDAIFITRHMGVQYLWIDSLCIIQDDPSDWHSNASLMGSIYEDSFFTIAASDATDSGEGCFLYHPNTQIKISLGSKIAIHARLSPHDQGFYHETEGANHAPAHVRHFRYQHSIWPPNTSLEDRAWAFQERLLSPRTLHFSRHELSFECRESISCECSAEEMPLVSQPASEVRGWAAHDQRFKLIPQPLSSLPRREWEGVYRQWCGIVERYSARSLTYYTDRLTALAGTASRFAADNRHISRYCAGLWEEYLIPSLLWMASVSLNVYATPNRRYQDRYIAPSWSWASIIGPIEFEPLYRNTPCQFLAEIAAIQVDVQEPRLNPYGAIRKASIELEASLIPILIEKESYLKKLSRESYSLWQPQQRSFNIEGFRHRFNLWEDIGSSLADVDTGPSEMLDGTKVHILPLMICRSSNSEIIAKSLVVKETQRVSEYYRVGIAWYTGSRELWESWIHLGLNGTIRLI